MKSDRPRNDMILRGGRVICPATGVDAIMDVVIRDGRIANIARNLDADGARVNVSGSLVLPGLIDTHAHCYQFVTGRFGLDPDLVGVSSGVTTIVDQGGASCMTFPGFRRFIVEPAKTRVLAFMSTYLVGGLEGHFYPELYRPSCIDVE